MKKLMIVFILFTGIVVSAADEYKGPLNTSATSMPSMIGGLLFSNTKRAMYASPRVDVRTCKVLGKVKGSVSMWNALLLVNIGDIGWDALKADALKDYPDADDIVNFTVDAEYLNIIFIFIRLKANISGIAVKYDYGSKDL